MKKQKKISPPKTKQNHTPLITHNHERNDPYYWMRLTDEQKDSTTPDKQTKDVLNYIKKENTYKNNILAHTKELQKSLFKEITARIKKDDNSVPYFFQNYWYYVKYQKGLEYPIYCRKKDTLSAKEDIILNVNELAKNHDYISVVGLEISPDSTLCAFGIDTVSRRIYTGYIKNLSTGKLLPDTLKQTTGSYAWADDNNTLFYTKKNTKTLLAETIYRHQLGQKQTSNTLIYKETDKSYHIGVYRSKSQKYIIIYNSSTLSDEYHILESNKPNGTFKSFTPREKAHEYSIYHYKNKFYILTNWKAKNFRLMTTAIEKTHKKYWKEVISHNEDVFINDIDIFKDHLVISERKNALPYIKIINQKNNKEHYINFKEPVYSVSTSCNVAFKTKKLRYIFSSLKTPLSTIEYDMNTKRKTLLKQDIVVGGHNPNDYITKRLVTKATDGNLIPVSLIYKKSFKKSTKNPLLLYGYGSYGINISPSFSSTRLSLLDRGFVFAIAHIRGSQTKGKQWYENGKLLKKKNTFTDFIDVSKDLIKKRYTSSKHLYAMGGSAGGLLMGAITNMAPQLYNGIISAVPFVDVVTTMLDESIPLTTGEFDEWGNPKQKKYYDYMLSYSPYDQIKKQVFPNMLITSGFHDSQVQYWEPLKYVAKCRDHWLGHNKLLLHMEMKSGHSGKSGRFRQFKEVALEYAFLIDLEKNN